MNITTVAGLAIIAVPFVGLTIVAVRQSGWMAALGIWGITAAVAGCALLGAWLIVS